MPKRKTNRRGASVVETAILLPFLMIVTFGAIDVAQYINTGQVISNTSREGARIASRFETKTVSEIESAAKTYLLETIPGLSDENFEKHVKIEVAEVQLSQNSATKKSIPQGDLSRIESGSALSIQVEMDFAAIRWLPGFDYKPFKTDTICRRE